jgi:hypothetical protein
MTKKHIWTLGTAAVLLGASVVAAKGKGILFPDWSQPTAGTYEAPHAEIGKKSAEPWTTTTIASAVEGKTLKGEPMTVVGEVIDYSCYLQVGKHGDKHRDCGQKCVRNGQPVGLLAKDGTIYLLMDEEHNPRRDGLTEFRKAAIEHMAHVVKVNGTYSQVEGQKALYVQGFAKE